MKDNEEENSKISNDKQNKLDWKEIEKWNNIKEAEIESEYGADITKLGKDNKKIDKFTKIIKNITMVIYIIGKTAVILGLVIALILIVFWFKDIAKVMAK